MIGKTNMVKFCRTILLHANPCTLEQYYPICPSGKTWRLKLKKQCYLLTLLTNVKHGHYLWKENAEKNFFKLLKNALMSNAGLFSIL